jgi:hypothetical protein
MKHRDLETLIYAISTILRSTGEIPTKFGPWRRDAIPVKYLRLLERYNGQLNRKYGSDFDCLQRGLGKRHLSRLMNQVPFPYTEYLYMMTEDFSQPIVDEALQDWRGETHSIFSAIMVERLSTHGMFRVDMEDEYEQELTETEGSESSEKKIPSVQETKRLEKWVIF